METPSLISAQKIAIVGISGSGKSTLSRRIAKLTGLPLHHMDLLFWKSGWEAVPQAVYLAQHEEIVSSDRWIIEGYVEESMAERVEKADLILYLDYSGPRCFWRAFTRMLKHRGRNRPELPEGCLDHFSKRFLWIVLTRGERKRVEAALKGVDGTKIKRFKSPNDLNAYLKQAPTSPHTANGTLLK